MRNIISVMLLMIAMGVSAQPAPVYEADALSQELGSTNSGQVSSTQPASVPKPLDVMQRIQRLEQQVTNLQTGEAAERVESLQGQVQNLRGQIEQITHQMDALQTEQKQLYAEFDQRLAAMQIVAAAKKTEENEKTKYTKPVESETEAVDREANLQANVAEEQKLYQQAYNYINQKKYDIAINTFQSMLKKYPNGQLAADGHYWLGELYGLLNQRTAALKQFATVTKNFPKSARVIDAQLKIGLIYAANGQWSEAKVTLLKVIKLYPKSASARIAKEQLKQLTTADPQ